MEPLIRLRLLTSKLNNNEQHQFIQTIIKTFDVEQIISFIFNNFYHKYLQNKTYDDGLQNIINIITNIIESRKSKQSKQSLVEQSSEKKVEGITMDLLPSEMIRECGSYLDVKDYMRFSRSNRSIYCASNSPLTVKKLDISNIAYYDGCDLNRFRLMQSAIICPYEFNEFESSSYPLNHHFPRLNRLYLCHEGSNNHELIETFINSKWINFTQITDLKCDEFGTSEQLYDFDSFCHFLAQFPNVTCLVMQNVYLTEFNDENEEISRILPNLNSFVCDNEYAGNNSAKLLRNKLLTIYSQQFISMRVNEQEMSIDTHIFGKLKHFGIFHPTDNSLQRIIDSSEDLQILSLIDFANIEIIKNTITKSFKKYNNLKYISFRCNEKMLKDIIRFVEMALFDTKEMYRKSLTIVYEITTGDDDSTNIGMREIGLYITRVINALDASQIENFMLGFHFPMIHEATYLNTIIDKFRQSHLAISENDNKQTTIIISNKTCKINGYSEHCCFSSYI